MAYIKLPKSKQQAREYRKWLAKGVGHKRATNLSKKGVVTSFAPNLDGS